MTFKPPSKAQRRMLDKAQSLYSNNLGPALEYLAGRGISSDHAAIAGLGVVTGEVVDHERMTGRLAIPYITPAGVVNMSFRCIKDHDHGAVGCKKYYQHEGLCANLYYVQAVEDAVDFMCLAEGELDALTLNICGIPALGVGGATKWEPHWTEVLDDFQYVYVMLDGDDAGEKFGAKVIKHIPHAVRIAMPPDEDVNSMYVKQGKLYLHERLSGGVRNG